MKRTAAILTTFFLLAGSTPRHVDPIEPMSAPIERVGVVQIKCKTLEGTAFSVGGRLVSTAHTSIFHGSCKVAKKGVTVVNYDRGLDYMELTGSAARKVPSAGDLSCSGFVTGDEYEMVGYIEDQATQTMISLTATDRTLGGLTSTGNELTALRVLDGETHHGMSGGPIISLDGRITGYVVGTLSKNRTITLARDLRDTRLCQQPRVKE